MTERSPWYEEGRHSVSPFNYDPSITGSQSFPDPMVLFDSTIRKLILTPGTRAPVSALVEVAERLAGIGISEMWLNVDWWGDEQPNGYEFDVCAAILERVGGVNVTVYSDAFVPNQVYAFGRMPEPSDALSTLRDIGVKAISAATFDPRNEAGRQRQLDAISDVFERAQREGIACVATLPDCGRSDFGFLVRVANHGIAMGAARIEISDSYSSLSPEAMRLFVRTLRGRLDRDVPSTVHIHNDFGLANAGAIAAASEGAYPDVSVNGLSYRGGFAALEEVVVALELLYGVRTGIRMERLWEISHAVADVSGVPVHPLKPVTGRNAYLRQEGVWVNELLRRGRDAFPPPAACFAPDIIGAPSVEPLWTHLSSRATVRARATEAGIDIGEGDLDRIMADIHGRSEEEDGRRPWITDAELPALLEGKT